MLQLLTLVSAAASPLASSKVLALRGGMDLGPIDAGNVGGVLKVAAALAGDQAHDAYLAIGLPPPEAQAPRVLSLSGSRPIAEAAALCALTWERATLHSAAAVAD